MLACCATSLAERLVTPRLEVGLLRVDFLHHRSPVVRIPPGLLEEDVDLALSSLPFGRIPHCHEVNLLTTSSDTPPLKHLTKKPLLPNSTEGFSTDSIPSSLGFPRERFK